MKIFLYKFIIVLFGIFLLFEILVGSKLKYYERNFKSILSKQGFIEIKEKAREEMKSAIEKDIYLKPEDAPLDLKIAEKQVTEIPVDLENELRELGLI